MTEVPDLSQLTDPSQRTKPGDPKDDTPSMRAVILCKDPTEAFELDIVNLEGVIIGMRVDGSSLLYIPWSRVKYVEVPKSQPSNG